MHDEESSSAELMRLINGYQVSQTIHVAAALGIADLLADGPRAVDELAPLTATDESALHRLLRALAAIGILHEKDHRTFGLTELGQELRGPAGAWAAFIGRPYHWTAWGHLMHSVRTGENAFHAMHGVDVWEYRAAHPEEAAIFDAAMTGLSLRVNTAVAAAHDFGRYGVIVDVGGGRGALLASILEHHPGVRGVLFDQPAVVAGAHADGFEIVGGSFFESVPQGGDAYLLKSVLHDWEGEPAIRILRVCRRAADTGTTLLIIERQFSLPAAKLSDLNMLVGPGGRERTTDEYAALLAASGYELVGETPTVAGVTVFEGRAI
ncbi:hydroxyneurosporene-O-methyltransferase [Solirubrobacter pauli]|uniref:Hydroxyneurosporene-O-methyltransferase n=1 Tax=Solirubrobacter pauli TaxID=166793 RepID=A0A660LAV7_9ACTN|nr:methyltransferase [Solirubrobacter pauli]RKQ92187.1 hydroxyneurosporene-O-methyltransferase [Solirubrobacter pauli]